MKRQAIGINIHRFGRGVWAAVLGLLLFTGRSHAALVGHWTFEAGEEFKDLTGNFPDLLLAGESRVAVGMLVVTGDGGTTAGGWAVSDTNGVYRGPVLTNKTLVAWVRLTSLSDWASAGSALTLDRVSSDQFDGIVFGERQENVWMSGSSNWDRTQDFDPSFPEYELDRIVMHAFTYEYLDGGQLRVTGYRDGGFEGQYVTGKPSRWETGDARVVFGIRHGTLAGGPGSLDGFIHEARIYDTALSQPELYAMFLDSLTSVTDADVDGLRDDLEFQHFGGLGENPAGDPDGDGLSNLVEFQRGTNPRLADTDGDGLSDRVETGTRVYAGVNDTGTQATRADTDRDGLSDAAENPLLPFDPARPQEQSGSDPNIADTDGDGIRDGDEARAGTNPANPADPVRPLVETSLVGHWTFEAGKELVDLTGNFPPLLLVGDAQVRDGQLSLSGSGTRASGWAITDSHTGNYVGPVITNKTLMVWATMRGLGDVAVAGSLLTLDRVASDQFDAIVFGERQNNRWASGSSAWSRTVDLSPGFEEKTVGKPFHLAVSYETLATNRMRVTAYRNGVRIGQYEAATPSSWNAGDAEVMFGIRHGNAATGGEGAVDALIDEARVYCQALNADEIRRIYAPTAQGPVLNVRRDGGRIRLDWTDAAARLEGATAVSGPWSAIANAAAPYATETAGAAARFFRLVK